MFAVLSFGNKTRNKFVATCQTTDYQIHNTRINHNDDKGNPVDACNVRNLYYRQESILCMPNKEPRKPGEQKGAYKFKRSPYTWNNNNKRQFQPKSNESGTESEGYKICRAIQT